MTREPYRPSNGTEGEYFILNWCARCKRDIDQDCEILAATFAYDVDEPEYPCEWTVDDQDRLDPQCSAYVDIDSPNPLPTPRCAHTEDMFGESNGTQA